MKEESSLSLQGILSLLRLSGYDCDVFYRYKDALARIYMGLGDYETAYELFENSIQYVSNHHVAWHNMGICAYYLQDYERAIQCFMRVGAVWVGVTGRRWS